MESVVEFFGLRFLGMRSRPLHVRRALASPIGEPHLPATCFACPVMATRRCSPRHGDVTLLAPTIDLFPGLIFPRFHAQDRTI
jgi:hypothetical protein